MKRCAGNLNTYYYIKRSQFKRAAHCLIPTLSHSGKSKTIETVKRSVVGRGSPASPGRRRQRKGTGEAQGIFRAWLLIPLF